MCLYEDNKNSMGYLRQHLRWAVRQDSFCIAAILLMRRGFLFGLSPPFLWSRLQTLNIFSFHCNIRITIFLLRPIFAENRGILLYTVGVCGKGTTNRFWYVDTQLLKIIKPSLNDYNRMRTQLGKDSNDACEHPRQREDEIVDRFKTNYQTHLKMDFRKSLKFINFQKKKNKSRKQHQTRM